MVLFYIGKRGGGSDIQTQVEGKGDKKEKGSESCSFSNSSQRHMMQYYGVSTFQKMSNKIKIAQFLNFRIPINVSRINEMRYDIKITT